MGVEGWLQCGIYVFNRAWKDCLQCGVYVCEWALKGWLQCGVYVCEWTWKGWLQCCELAWKDGYSAVYMSVS